MTANERLAEIKARAGIAYNAPFHDQEDAWVELVNIDVPALVAVLEAVLDLHDSEWDCEDPSNHLDTSCPACQPWCVACRGHYPCPTVTAINDALGGTK